MADLRGCYDVNDEASAGLEVLPAGQYVVKITRSGWKDTKKGDGKFLLIEMTVVEGEHQGKVILDRLNLQNPSQEAVKIARGQFASLREAVGVLDPKDSTQLHNLRFQIVLKCEKRNDDPTKWSNAVLRYVKKGETVTTPQQRDGAAPYSRTAGPLPTPPPWLATYPDSGTKPADDVPF